MEEVTLFKRLMACVSLYGCAENKERAMCRRDDCLKGLRLVRVTQMSCDDFLMMGVRYQHRDPPSPDMDYIALRVDLRDTRSGSVYQVRSLSFILYICIYVFFIFFMLVMLAMSIYIYTLLCEAVLVNRIILIIWPNYCKNIKL